MRKHLSSKTLGGNSLWASDTELVRLLGLCPLVAISYNAVNALALGLATIAVFGAANLTLSLLRRHAAPEIRLPAAVVVIATVVTVIELAMNAWLHDLYRVLGAFIPLIAATYAMMGHAEVSSSRRAPMRAMRDGLAIGAGILGVLFTIGLCRELLGQGTLFAHAADLFGVWARPFEITLIPHYRGFLLAALPPGALVMLALLIASGNALGRRQAREQIEAGGSVSTGSPNA